MLNPRHFTFIGGTAGAWRIVDLMPVVGETLAVAERLEISNESASVIPSGAKWSLRGVASNERYTIRAEKDLLLGRQVALGRPEATCAALIPIRKSAQWWCLTQDERRTIFEEQSRHVQTGLKYLPAIARRLHHCRDLSESEPFDFLTLFDYAPAFEEMLAILRATAEWSYVEREVDIRLVRTKGEG